MAVTFQVVLFNPQIPPNTGNVLRICANTGSNLHIIKPIGFSLNEKSMRRAGLDYYSSVKMYVYDNLNDFLSKNNFKNIYLITKFGKKRYDEVNYKRNDYLMFGSEINGLSEEVYKKLNKSTRIFIPMYPKNRSINLANAVSICVYEAWKQINFSTF
ncbi:MAG: tRNA (uridine(34)/cytosine(34)/5-carboxymethylaminomethyluridine(34)-2'-O)-methyltransferase TrmL [alpha proteobacterium MED-G10]|nr:MAG: tRNA (uridine(34)/cytosine(34)/5-carboxymethylaminomethyluridine(34)-2'-O)-methyltransferase TrmL [alpha proteobacterium MED-G10]|tara:strand:- start:1357 stop:1827 length:471 start_codon:yes stop_codon:yes gene_type:complete